MAYGHITVGDLRKVIEGMDDNSPVLVKPHSSVEFGSHDRISKRNEDGTRTVINAVLAPSWNYNTREIHNAYKANDDRYSHNSIILLEIGEFSP